MICPEFRHLWKGVENADSVVINPHKWLGAPQECTAHFVKKPELLTKTLSIQPEYLKTYNVNGIVNFSEWSIQLGRRFRALKVWFLLRAYGQEGLRSRIRNHVAWAQGLAARLDEQPDFEISTKPVLSLFSFRYTPGDDRDPNALNQQLVVAPAQTAAAAAGGRRARRGGRCRLVRADRRFHGAAGQHSVRQCGPQAEH